MALTDNLISYWKLDESSGNRADSHGSNTLTNNNSTPSATGKINSGADFTPASSHYLSVADNASLSPTSEMSVWVKLDALQDYAAFVSKWNEDASARTFGIALETSKFRFWISDDGGNFDAISNTTSVSTGTWYHIVTTYKNETNGIKIYVNGTAAQTSPSNSTSVFDSSAEFRVARAQKFAGLTNIVDGVIDEVGYWSRALTSQEVSDLYNSGSGFAYPFSGGGAVFIPKIMMS